MFLCFAPLRMWVCVVFVSTFVCYICDLSLIYRPMLSLLSPITKLSEEAESSLLNDGLACYYEGVDVIALPLALKHWSYNNQNKYALAYHVNKVFEEDRMVGAGREKHAEYVLYHIEAAKRISLGTNRAGLNVLFEGARFNNESFAVKTVSVFSESNAFTTLVSQVQKIEERYKENILELLEAGRIVVSKHPTESALEWVAPLWHKGKMSILATQVRRQLFTRTRTRTHIRVMSCIKNRFV